MYTAVLMMALSGTTGEVDFGGGRGCGGSGISRCGGGGLFNRCGGGGLFSRCGGGGHATRCSGGGLFSRCGGGHATRCSGGGLFNRCGGGLLHRRNRCHCSSSGAACSGSATTTPGNGKGSTGAAGDVKMSKEVADLINGDKSIKEAYDGIGTTAEKQKFVDGLQKTFDDAAKDAEKKNKKKGKSEEEARISPAAPVNHPSLQSNVRTVALENRFALLNVLRFVK